MFKWQEKYLTVSTANKWDIVLRPEGVSLIYTKNCKYDLREKLVITEIIDIFTSEDMENMPLEYKMWFCLNFF